jgi:hypothetical protein
VMSPPPGDLRRNACGRSGIGRDFPDVKEAHVKLVDDKRVHVAAPQRERTDNETSNCQCADGSGTEGQRTECNCPNCRRPRPCPRYCASEHLPRGTGSHGAGSLMSRVHLVHSFTSVFRVTVVQQQRPSDPPPSSLGHADGDSIHCGARRKTLGRGDVSDRAA